MSEPVRRALPPSVFARLADATRYVITGVSPDTWFGPLQPLAPMAPPEVKGRQWDYPFGANLNYIPRAEDGVSFPELRGLADALPLLRAVIETRKDQIAAQSYAVRARARGESPGASKSIDAVTCFLARPDRRHSFAVEARDQSQIEIFGPRVGSTVQAHEICDEFIMGPAIAQTILQRALYVRTKFTFKLSWEYCLLDPMDIVTITDANLGLSNYPVRVIEIEEDDKGLLSFTCEELVTGVSNPAFNPNASSTGFQPNQGVPAVEINQPLLFEPPPGLTGGVAQVWFGASGINGGGGSQWGGAHVYVSTDNVTYSQIAVLTSPMRQRFLTASLPAAAGWDSVNTLAVDLTESGGTLSGTTQDAAQAGATLSLVDNELMAYETAALTSTSNYNLTGLARSLSGTVGAAHSSGTPFYRIDGAVIHYNVPANFIGKTIYFKFQSFNIFGGGLEDLSTVAFYSFTPTLPSTVVTSSPPNGPPTPPAHPITVQLQTGFALDLGSVNNTPSIADDFGLVTGGIVDEIDLGAVATLTPHPIAVQLLAGSPVDLGLITGAVTLSDDFGSTNDAVVDVINLGTVP